MDLNGPFDYERETLEKAYGIMDALATLRHDWCQWEYELDSTIKWECEEEW